MRALELKTIGAARAEHVKLERAFNILGHPELRAHYERLLAIRNFQLFFHTAELGVDTRSRRSFRSGETVFARRILALVPDKTHRRFHTACPQL